MPFVLRPPSHFCATVTAIVSWSLPNLFIYREQTSIYLFGSWYGLFSQEGTPYEFQQVHGKYDNEGVRTDVQNETMNVKYYFETAVVQTVLIAFLFLPFHFISFVLAITTVILMELLAQELSHNFVTRLDSYVLACVTIGLLLFSLPDSLLYKLARKWYNTNMNKSKFEKDEKKYVGQLLF